MTEVSLKYAQIIETGKELFWKHGVKRVSIEEICREANVSKMTFYKFFPNKVELAKEIIRHVIGGSVKEFKELVDSNLSFTDKIKRIFAIKLEAIHDVSEEFIADLYKNQELGLHKVVEELGQQSMGVFVGFLKDSQEKGLIRKDIKIEFILAYQASLSQMMDNPQLMSLYNKTEDFVIESMNFMFYGVMPINQNKDD